MPKFLLVIQTAFIGDVILATPVIEKLHKHYPGARIDFMFRKGNEQLLSYHPYLSKIYIWDKRNQKLKNLFSILREVRKVKYDYVINFQRFFSTGLFVVLSGAKTSIGFSKNPCSFLFSMKLPHNIGNGVHETERNLSLIKDITDSSYQRPILYPSSADYLKVYEYKNRAYVCFAPASVWFTKQLPVEQWIRLGKLLVQKYKVILLGAAIDRNLCDQIMQSLGADNVLNLCGKLTLLQSAALMKDAVMNYVNDSSPLHLASGVNAPTTVFFCSTVPDFGFGPLADQSIIAQIDYKLYCRPCSLHGKRICPEGHFKCANEIECERYAL